MPKKVLVVDDSVFMRDIIKDILAAGGFTVVALLPGWCYPADP